VLCHLITSTDDGCVSIKYLISVHTAALMQRSCSSLAMPIVFRYRAIKQDLWCMMQRCTAAAAAAATNMQRPWRTREAGARSRHVWHREATHVDIGMLSAVFPQRKYCIGLPRSGSGDIARQPRWLKPRPAVKNFSLQTQLSWTQILSLLGWNEAWQ